MPDTNYVTVAEMRTIETVTVAEASDAKLLLLIQEAEKDFEQFCLGRQFYKRTLTVLLDGDGTELLDLAQYAPIITITSVSVEGDVLASDEYSIYSSSGLIRIKKESASVYTGSTYYVFPIGTKNVQVIGQFGYDPIPVDMKKAIRKLVLREIRAKLKLGQFSSESIGDYSYTKDDVGSNITGDREIDSIIDRYKSSISITIVKDIGP